MQQPAGLHWLDVLVTVVYFAVIVVIGVRAGRYTHTLQDFFYGGRRFAWWLVAISSVATLVGSYSFIQYSETGFKFGFSSMYQYTNEWFVLPLFLFGWLPLLYYNRITSVPEYFEKRFDRRTRVAFLVALLIYLEVYIGINLLTIGRAMHAVMPIIPGGTAALPATGDLNWPQLGDILLWAALMAVVSASYLHAGGQTSVLFTDLVQGLLLIFVGLLVVGLGIYHVGGLGELWAGLSPQQRMPFAPLNTQPAYHTVGVFWDDAVVGTFGFYAINQGVLMRFLSARSVRDGRKAMCVVVLLLMPLAAVAVSGAGWVGRAMATRQVGPFATDQKSADDSAAVDAVDDGDVAREIFIRVARAVCRPGVYGLVVAAVVAALMSTLDTLITAVSAIAVNDIWRPLRPAATDAQALSAARRTAIVATLAGLLLLPVMDSFSSIYLALTAFTTSIVPPMLIVVVLAMAWPRMTARAAFWTLMLGTALIVLSWVLPAVIRPLAHGVPFDPSRPYVYMRALYGLVVSASIAVVVTWFDVYRARRRGEEMPQPREGLLLRGLDAARNEFKRRCSGSLEVGDLPAAGDTSGAVTVDFSAKTPAERGVGRCIELPTREGKVADGVVRLPREAMERLLVDEGDLLYVSDTRWWLGGLRAIHVSAGAAARDEAHLILSGETQRRGNLRADRPVRVEKMM